MGILNNLNKFGILGLIIATGIWMPMMVITPRLGIADSSMVELDTDTLDITILEYNTTYVTLDFWLRVGLARKEYQADTDDDGELETIKFPYYYENGSVNESNLKDEEADLIIPRVFLKAEYKGELLGQGSSPATLHLNVEHPTEYLHLYLTGKRTPDSGLMYLFSDLVENGFIDSMLFSDLPDDYPYLARRIGISEGGLDAGALLESLDLSLTAYIGAAPVTLSGDVLGLSTLPVIESNDGIKLAEGSPYQYDYNAYNESRDAELGSLDRFMIQLGLGGGAADEQGMLKTIHGLLPDLVKYDEDKDEYYFNDDLDEVVGFLVNALFQLFDSDMITNDAWFFNVSSFYRIWLNNSNTLYTDASKRVYQQDLAENLLSLLDEFQTKWSEEMSTTKRDELKDYLRRRNLNPADFETELSDWAGNNQTLLDATADLIQRIKIHSTGRHLIRPLLATFLGNSLGLINATAFADSVKQIAADSSYDWSGDLKFFLDTWKPGITNDTLLNYDLSIISSLGNSMLNSTIDDFAAHLNLTYGNTTNFDAESAKVNITTNVTAFENYMNSWAGTNTSLISDKNTLFYNLTLMAFPAYVGTVYNNMSYVKVNSTTLEPLIFGFINDQDIDFAWSFVEQVKSKIKLDDVWPSMLNNINITFQSWKNSYVSLYSLNATNVIQIDSDIDAALSAMSYDNLDNATLDVYIDDFVAYLNLTYGNTTNFDAALAKNYAKTNKTAFESYLLAWAGSNDTLVNEKDTLLNNMTSVLVEPATVDFVGKYNFTQYYYDDLMSIANSSGFSSQDPDTGAFATILNNIAGTNATVQRKVAVLKREMDKIAVDENIDLFVQAHGDSMLNYSMIFSNTVNSLFNNAEFSKKSTMDSFLNQWIPNTAQYTQELSSFYQDIVDLDENNYTYIMNSTFYNDIIVNATLLDAAVATMIDEDNPGIGMLFQIDENGTVIGDPDGYGDIAFESDILNLFIILYHEGYGFSDFIKSLQLTVPELLTSLLFQENSSTGPYEYVVNNQTYTYGRETPDESINPTFTAATTAQAASLLLVSIIIAFVV
ncbi:MAG: hypothetical protein ACTSWN_15890, partial [Promethearchaeota archaeon]